MTITATFSNGTTDTYKGKRDVKAAWAIVKDGEVLMSGHSLDRRRAEGTAANNVKYLGLKPEGWEGAVDVPQSPRTYIGVDYKKSRVKAARARGLLDDTPRGSLSGSQLWNRTVERLKRYNSDFYAAQRAMIQIEVVDL